MDASIAEFQNITEQIPGWPVSNKAPLCYLATPYTRYAGGLEGAFKEASRIAAVLLRAGVNIYSPIVHMHSLAIHGDLDPLDHKIWLPANQAMMTACDTLIVATMEGWDESLGVAHELAWYREQRRRIFYLDPLTFVMTREALDADAEAEATPHAA